MEMDYGKFIEEHQKNYEKVYGVPFRGKTDSYAETIEIKKPDEVDYEENPAR